MKRLLLPSLVVSSLVLFTIGCEEKPVVTGAPPPPVPLKAKPKVYRGDDGKAAEAAREAAMAREIAELEAEEEKLRQEIAQEQLAVDRAALEEEQRGLDQERAAWLSGQVAAAVPPRPKTQVSTPVLLPPARDYSLFYTELAVHGRWFQSVDYGYVWQPAVALQTSWRPYTIGRWAACDRGWTWLSDEPFGWATYHYGRWTKLKGCGWIWVPGEIWAPAWVAWRRSDQYVGWCPLPPETLYRDEVTYDSSIDKLCGIQPSSYIFIAVKQFCLPVHRHCEPPERSGVVCRDTTNITRLKVSRHRVDGSGPKYEWIRDRQPRPPDRYTLASEPLTKGDRKFRIDRDKLCVYSPVMRAPWNATLHPREVAGPLPAGVVVPQGIVPPDKIQRRFREDKKHWMEAGAKALQGESARRLKERQERVGALTAAVQNPPTPRRTTRPPSQPSEPNQTPPRPGAKLAGTPPQLSMAERRTQREQIRKEVDARQTELARLRGLPAAGGTAPSRIVSGDRPAVPPVVTPGAHPRPVATDPALDPAPGRLPEVAPILPRVDPAEAPRVVETLPVTSPGTVETPVAGTPVAETEPAGAIVEVPPAHSGVTAPEVRVRRKVQTDLETRRAEVARLKETLTVRQQQKRGPQPQEDPSMNGSGQSETSGPLVGGVEETGPVPAAEPTGPTPPVQVAGPQPPARVTGPLPEQSAARQEAVAERREKAARINGELAARQQALQQQREAREQAQAERRSALAESAAQAARQRETATAETAPAETAQAAQMALAAEQQQKQQQLAETAARQQELAGEAAHQQQQAQLAAQAEAAREQQQRETEANRQREAAGLDQQVQAAREQAQRKAEALARQEEMARQQREAAERAQQEQAAREQAQRQAEERARQEEMARQQREAAERAQQEQAAREQAQRQAEERARQEEMARQQREAAERAQQEQAAREQAQRQAEEQARQEQARQEQAAREQAAREQAQRQAEEAARAAAEAAKNGNK